jgi:hypothetical protein
MYTKQWPLYLPQHARIRIVLQSWLTNGVYGLAIGTHHVMLYNLVIRQEPFLFGWSDWACEP